MQLKVCIKVQATRKDATFDTMIALHLVYVALNSYKLFNEYFVKWNKVNKKNVAF